VTAEVLRIVSALAHPVLPESTAKVWKLLGQTGNLASLELDTLRWGQLWPGVKLGEFQALFPRVEKTEAMERIEAMENQSQKPAAAPAPAGSASAPTPAAASAPAAAPAATDKIGIEDFAKVEMRVGQIQTAERIAGADKLLKLTVDIGTEIRQICAGIAQFYEPEKLIGRKVAVVTNLAPRKLRGVESNGMIVAAAVGPEGRPVLAGFLEDVEVGARLK
jgi:methionyl-tRNA synthetase